MFPGIFHSPETPGNRFLKNGPEEIATQRGHVRCCPFGIILSVIFFSLSAAHCVLSLSVIGQSVKTVLTGSTFQRLSGYTSVSGFVAFSPFEEEPSEGLQRKLLCKIKKL